MVGKLWYLKTVSKNYNILLHKVFKLVVGEDGYKITELKRRISNKGMVTYYPHIHMICQNYTNGYNCNSKYYLSADELTDIWSSCLGETHPKCCHIKPVYEPIGLVDYMFKERYQEHNIYRKLSQYCGVFSEQRKLLRNSELIFSGINYTSVKLN